MTCDTKLLAEMASNAPGPIRSRGRATLQRRKGTRLMALEICIDDEATFASCCLGVLEDAGYAVRTAGDSSAALNAIEDRRPSCVLDVWLQGSKLDGCNCSRRSSGATRRFR